MLWFCEKSIANQETWELDTQWPLLLGPTPLNQNTLSSPPASRQWGLSSLLEQWHLYASANASRRRSKKLCMPFPYFSFFHRSQAVHKGRWEGEEEVCLWHAFERGDCITKTLCEWRHSVTWATEVIIQLKKEHNLHNRLRHVFLSFYF